MIREDISLLRVAGERAYTVIAVCGGPAPVGTEFAVGADDEGLLAEIARRRRPARRDDYVGRGGPAIARDRFGVGSAVGVPVVVDDRIWGVLLATTIDGRRLPSDTEQRLGQFVELMAAALANAQARAELLRLADEQAALREVAELIARTAPTEAVFTAIAANASRLLDDAPMTLTRFGGERELVVLATCGGPAPVGTNISYEAGTLPDRARRTGVAVRVDDYTGELDADLASRFGMVAAVSVPISVRSKAWGMLTATSADGPLPAGAEERLLQFSGLLSAAMSNVQARAELEALADEQAALRSVAELAAQDVPAERVLAAVAQQASRLSDVDFSTLLRFEPDGSTEIAALDGAPEGVTVGMRAPASGDGATQRVWRTGRPARIDNLAAASSQWAQVARGHGFTTSAAVPILIRGTLWGVLVVVGRDRPLPLEIHTQLTRFADLAATAIAAAQGRRELEQLAAEHAALRGVAELVARGVDPTEVFATVVLEASHLLGEHDSVLLRYDKQELGVVMASCNSQAAPGSQLLARAGTPAGEVLRTGAPYRFDHDQDHDVASDVAADSVAVPITVEGTRLGNARCPVRHAAADRYRTSVDRLRGTGCSFDRECREQGKAHGLSRPCCGHRRRDPTPAATRRARQRPTTPCPHHHHAETCATSHSRRGERCRSHR